MKTRCNYSTGTPKKSFGKLNSRPGLTQKRSSKKVKFQVKGKSFGKIDR